MKSVIALLALVVATTAHALPTAREARMNFDACADQNPYWMQNFGRYVVAFDMDSAYAACGHMGVQKVTCRANGSTLIAGYYCQDMTGGE